MKRKRSIKTQFKANLCGIRHIQISKRDVLRNAPQTTTKGELVSAKLQYNSYIRMMREYYYNKHWCWPFPWCVAIIASLKMELLNIKTRVKMYIFLPKAWIYVQPETTNNFPSYILKKRPKHSYCFYLSERVRRNKTEKIWFSRLSWPLLWYPFISDCHENRAFFKFAVKMSLFAQFSVWLRYCERNYDALQRLIIK